MAQPIKGYEGTITVNDGTDDIPMGFVNNWEVSLETEEQTVGPFIGDGGVLYSYTTSRSLSGTLEATVPIGKDAGQTAMVEATLNGDNVSLVLVTTGGYTVTLPASAISGFSMSQDAGETVTVSFDFRSSGAFTIV